MNRPTWQQCNCEGCEMMRARHKRNDGTCDCALCYLQRERACEECGAVGGSHRFREIPPTPGAAWVTRAFIACSRMRIKGA